MKKWFDKLIGCSFYLRADFVGEGNEGIYIYCGSCEHSDHDYKRDKLQYEFYTEGKPLALLSYKEARAVMGAMIDKY